jgi:tetratricopeptide (TPR) repeat protein
MVLSGLWTAHAVWNAVGGGAAVTWRRVPSPPWRLAGVGLVGACVVAAWICVVQPYRADRLCRAGDALAPADPVAAVGLYQEAVTIAPSHDLYWAKLAEGCRKVETRPASAEERCEFGARARLAAEEAVRRAPASAPRLAMLGQVLSDLAFDRLAEPDEAVAAYAAALALDPRNAELLAEAAKAAWGLSRSATAREYLQRGTEIDPNQANLVALRGSVAMAEGHFEEADAHFDDAKSLDWHGEEDARLHALTAWGACLARLNRPAEAENWLRYVLERRPDWVPPRFTLAFTLTLSRRPDAADEFRKVIAASPNHPLAAESRKWLERLGTK